MYYSRALNILIMSAFMSLNYSFAHSDDFTEKKKEISDRQPVEMIVTFENLNPKRYTELNELLISVPGINYMGSCPVLKAYYFQFDSEKFSSVEEAFDALTIKTKEFQPLLKIGASISHVKSECDKI